MRDFVFIAKSLCFMKMSIDPVISCLCSLNHESCCFPKNNANMISEILSLYIRYKISYCRKFHIVS